MRCRWPITICGFSDRLPCAWVCGIFDHLCHCTLFFNVIQKLLVNFAYCSLTQVALIVDMCKQISSFHYTNISNPKWLLWMRKKQLQNINTKSKWRGVVPSSYDNAMRYTVTSLFPGQSTWNFTERYKTDWHLIRHRIFKKKIYKIFIECLWSQRRTSQAN